MTRRKNSLRLRGFDYTQEGEYFVTMCTNNGVCIFGRVEGVQIVLSHIGAIVDSCWQKIPVHFPSVRLNAHQIMPNHIHGIISIKDILVGAQHAAPLQKTPRVHRSQPVPCSLSAIVRSFKSAVTKETHLKNLCASHIWQRSFHDHVIRDAIDHFFIEQYINLNPLMWHLDQENPDARLVSDDELRNLLRESHGLDGQAIERIIEYRFLRAYGRPSAIAARKGSQASFLRVDNLNRNL